MRQEGRNAEGHSSASPRSGDGITASGGNSARGQTSAIGRCDQTDRSGEA